MVLCGRILFKISTFLLLPLQTRSVSPVFFRSYSPRFSTAVGTHSLSGHVSYNQPVESTHSGKIHDADVIIAKALEANCETEVFDSLVYEFGCERIPISHTLVARLLRRFQDDWKSALGVFRWVETYTEYKPLPEFYDKLVDILGKMKEMDKMNALVEQMREHHLVSLNTIAKMMRRCCGAGGWKDAVRIFDELESFGLEKNTESMNLLLDSLCKERKVEQARSIFLELKSHIPPNANTYNIFIHGWCKIKRVEEAQWTIQEMKGLGLRPCVISYSTIIQFYCSQSNFNRVYELLDEMQAQGCNPNVVTLTTVMHSLTKAGELKEALQIVERVKSVGCKPDTQFYNALIHTLGRDGQVEEAVRVFTKEMPENNINPNTSTYNSMIAMFCHHRQEPKALQYLRNLEISPYCKPDVQSFYPLLKMYFRDGKTDKCLISLLDDMVKKHHLCFDLATFTLLIHGLCRAGKCEWAYELFTEMVGQNIKPRYLTCSLLLQEIRQKNMIDKAEMIEDFIKKMKSS
ncbi:PREDICTED: pentatricopeptide repeat-containing protein At3g04130, mitochondrial [Erythranthe guttata]|uniref:pentatricopeptide repeat-containing protein At3g04130, mitochondrial n=1 Tax=Erythranthe guttata TaxID=4155 RepID=UPI00064D8C01|nr:PREDICTED: pentatricopeptide repeat-containing protein At3g04130, mitochondrial [Erythranthe guttata]XP_012851324.1 PREDICTED: pentatricopeptide repeat-containing protein At3g04130, mitochondrial [Erythranthe guttata]|eukprot:XP_012851323.1 PREDICTED: pentatricopeptide repeat-containing protein At3g04130, mitochondrial [Erythranthe guttata]